MVRQEKKSRIIITGIGLVSALGFGWEEFWKNLVAGKSGISRIDRFSSQGFCDFVGGEIKDFKVNDFPVLKKSGIMGRSSQFGVVASKFALEDANLKLSRSSRQRIGVCVGTTMGEPQVLEEINSLHFEKGIKSIKQQSALLYPSQVISFHIAKECHLNGPNFLFSNACASGNYSIGYAFDLIRSGQVDIMLAGGVDVMTRLNLTGFNRLLAVAPEKCQPFDMNRKGMLVGEGCGVVVMETIENALKRGAVGYAEVLGYGLSCDARHMTNPAKGGIAQAIRKALRNSNITPGQIDYISAHGTGTRENDRTECQAIQQVFGISSKKIPISSIKSMLGHTMGAASAIEAIACCLAIKDSKIPPTINFETPDPECDIDCVPNSYREKYVRIALNNSSAFGGNNACLALGEI